MILDIIIWTLMLGLFSWIILFILKSVFKDKKSKRDKKTYKRILGFENKLKKAIDIYFADAKQSFDRIVSLFSALFWTWLEVMFLKFFFIFAFGLVGYLIGSGEAFYSGSYEYSYYSLIENRALIDAFVKVIVLIVFILRVPIHYKKEVKKRE